jgi:hypothetical protein
VVTGWEIWPRDADLGRTLDPLSHWTQLDLVERYGPPDTWVLTGPASELAVFTPGMGCILDRGGVQIASGQVRHIGRKAEYDDQGRLQDNITLGFIADTKELWSRLCYPDPTHSITSTPSTFSAAHDTRTGTREALILAYTAANLGPAAPVTYRRLTSLALPTSLERGGVTTKKMRMDVLGDVVAELAERGGMRVRIVHDEVAGTPRLLMRIDDVEDVSTNIVFGSPDVARATGFVTSWGYTIEDPQTTDAIAFSAGELTAREATRLNSADAIALWSRRYEVLVDQRQTDEVDEITDALQDRLDEGATPTSVEFTIAPGTDIQHRVDFDTGYRVGIELPGLPQEVSDNTIREVPTTVAYGEPEQVSLVVGSPGAQTASTKQAARLNKALRRLALIERSR